MSPDEKNEQTTNEPTTTAPEGAETETEQALARTDDVQAAALDEQGAEAEAPPKRGRPRGFAAMSRDRVIEIARLGGRAAHAAGTAHEFTTDEAREAGRKGGAAPHVRRGAPAKPQRDLDAPPPSV